MYLKCIVFWSYADFIQWTTGARKSNCTPFALFVCYMYRLLCHSILFVFCFILCFTITGSHHVREQVCNLSILPNSQQCSFSRLVQTLLSYFCCLGACRINCTDAWWMAHRFKSTQLLASDKVEPIQRFDAKCLYLWLCNAYVTNCRKFVNGSHHDLMWFEVLFDAACVPAVVCGRCSN